MLAQRAAQVTDSITMAITAMAQKLKKEGQDVISFGAGEPDFDTPNFIKEAGIAAINQGKTKYTAATGIIELKNAVCDKLKRDQNLSYTPDQIIISCGAKHAIFNTIMTLIDPGDEVIIPGPYWVSYPDQVQLCGGVPVYIHTDDTSEFKVSPAQLKAAITPKTKLIIIGSPSNPTGSIYTAAELKALADVILTSKAYILSDEIYEKLIYAPYTHTSIAQVSLEVQNRTILINGVSKAYSMTGWRIGYSAAPIEISKTMGMIQSHSTSNPMTPAQWASVAALNGTETEVQKMRTEFEKRRNIMVATLNDINGVTCMMPHGAFYAFPNIKGCLGKQSPGGSQINDSAQFCEALLKEALVACVPGSGFGAEGYIRLSYATHLADIENGISRIKAWINQLT